MDDDSDFLDLASRLLERESEALDVETASSAEEALELLEDGGYDCVVSDYEMPGLHGTDFLREVRDRYPSLPFILFTGKGSEEVASEAISAGVTDYLQKGGGTDQYAILANRVRNAVDQRRTELELERSEDRLRLVLDNLPHPVFVVDEDMNYLLSNEAHAESHDRSVEEIEGMNSREVLTEEGIESFHEDLHRVLESGNALYLPDIAVPDDTDETRIYQARLVPFDVAGTEKDAVLGVSVDITDHKRQEERLRESQRRFRAVFNSPDAFIGILSPDGTLRQANKTALDFIDAEPEDVEGEPFWEADWWNHSSKLQQDLQEWIKEAAQDRYVGFEATHYGADGDEVVVDGVIRPVKDEDGNVTSLIAQGRDISERKERERRLERQKEWLDDFASTVSHDLRNPLSVAKGRLDLAMEEHDSEHLERVERAHDRMEELIEGLLEFARQGGASTEFDKVDLSKVVERCWRNVEAGDAELVNEAGVVFRADRSGLQQLLENLLRNAVEHGGSDVTLTVGDLDDGFYLEDDGEGIEPEMRDQVLETGFSTNDEGTGFGLTIVTEIAAAHGWNVDIKESSTGGARFEFTDVNLV